MLPSLSAQQVTMREDSTFVTSSSFFLDEVTVTAKSVINKGDKLSILPSEIQRKTATDGVELLNKMQLSRIMVDVMSGEITTPGNGEVQLRINGILVT